MVKGKGQSVQGQMTVQEAGRKGGEKRKQELGHEGYVDLGHKGGEAVKEKYGPEFYSEIGQKGGEIRGREIHEAAEYFKKHPEQRPGGRGRSAREK